MNEALRIRAGQRELTPDQQAEARRFAQERIRTQLSTDAVDEPAVEAFLASAYVMARLRPPTNIFWLNGPLQLVAAWTPPGVLDRVKQRLDRRVVQAVTPLAQNARWNSSSTRYSDASTCVWLQIREQVLSGVWDALEADGVGALKDSVGQNVNAPIRAAIANAMHPLIYLSVDAVTYKDTREETYNTYGIETVSSSCTGIARDSVMPYEDASYRAFYAFFDTYYVPNALHALDQVSQQVSGYWLGKDLALLVRRPRQLLRDSSGQLHSEAGKCIVYRDGWGFYAWHGVAVPRKVALRPGALTRDDFFRQRDLEVRRVIQERMGDRFVSALGGNIVDTGTRGVLYEVELRRDPERVARYIHLHDASTQREYHLRVPPTIATVAEAVAWTFNLTAAEYRPAVET
jgi:hypothetical protein